MFDKYPEIMTVDEVVDALRIGRNRMYELLESGKLKAFRTGRTWKIPKQCLIDYVKSSSKMED